jgi:hypothetical protein
MTSSRSERHFPTSATANFIYAKDPKIGRSVFLEWTIGHVPDVTACDG